MPSFVDRVHLTRVGSRIRQSLVMGERTVNRGDDSERNLITLRMVGLWCRRCVIGCDT